MVDGGQIVGVVRAGVEMVGGSKGVVVCLGGEIGLLSNSDGGNAEKGASAGGKCDSTELYGSRFYIFDYV